MVRQPWVFVISSGRPENVPKMEKAMGTTEMTWVVPVVQEPAYRLFTPEVLPAYGVTPPCIAAQRNLALDMATMDRRPAVLLDDDMRGFRLAHTDTWGSIRSRPIYLSEVIERLLLVAQDYVEARLLGPAPTENALWASRLPLLSTRAFIQGNALLAMPDSDVRYDPAMELSEDYDFCLQHLQRYGQVGRHNRILGLYTKRGNPGGLQDLPDRATMDVESRRRLAEKWPDHVTWPHPKKGEREVKVRWK